MRQGPPRALGIRKLAWPGPRYQRRRSGGRSFARAAGFVALEMQEGESEQGTAGRIWCESEERPDHVVRFGAPA